jgi:hypothetical protein
MLETAGVERRRLFDRDFTLWYVTLTDPLPTAA